MDGDGRNPYVILGLDYGADAEEAALGFAKATRRIRNTPDAPYGLEDATWALHQIEQAVENPDNAIGWYRIPADPGAYGFGDEAGLLRPPAENLPRQSGSSTSAVRELQARALREHLEPQITAAAVGVEPIPDAVALLPADERPSAWSWVGASAAAAGVFLITLGVYFLATDRQSSPSTEVQGVTTTTEALVDSEPEVALGWEIGGCASVDDGVARLAACDGAGPFVVHSVFDEVEGDLSPDETAELRFALAVLGIDVGDAVGSVPLTALVEGANLLSTPEGATPRPLLWAALVELDAANETDPSTYTVPERFSEHCGFLPFIVREDGVYCLLPPDEDA